MSQPPEPPRRTPLPNGSAPASGEGSPGGAAQDPSAGRPPGPPPAFEAFASLSRPVIITDPAYRIVHLNGRAEAFWGVGGDVHGRPLVEALGLSPPKGRELGEWARDVLHVALTTGDPFTCQAQRRGNGPRDIRLSGTRFFHGRQWYTAWIVLSEPAAPSAGDVPVWALRDPLTGLFNRHEWNRAFAQRDAAGGSLVVFDIDGLKNINDLFGHRAGDAALREAARALTEAAPDGALLVRFGGDEFVAVLPAPAPPGAASSGPPADRPAGGAEAFAARASDRAARLGEEAGLSVPLALGYGAASFAPGGLDAALQAADDALYQRKGVLLRARGAGRIVLTAAARGRLLAPAAEAQPAPGAFAHRFGPEWDQYFRRIFARSVEHAREFVEIAAPEPDSAVIEVAAGSGRITFDGGLAARVGPGGQLLVTDPSEAQLQVARGRAGALGCGWVRFLQATVEELPVASGTVDLVLGSTFLHFTDPVVALRSMARVVRPGGRVSVNAGLNMTWGPAWERILEPVRAELARFGLPMRGILQSRQEIEEAVAAAGLHIERAHLAGRERVEFPTADLALQVMRQVGFVPLLLKAVPAPRHPAVEAEVEARLRDRFARGVSQDDMAGGTDTISLVARKPA